MPCGVGSRGSLAFRFHSGWFGGVWFCFSKHDLERFVPNNCYCYAFMHVCRSERDMCMHTHLCLSTGKIISSWLLFCSDTSIQWSTEEERSFSLWKCRLPVRRLFFSTQPVISRQCSSKCLVYDDTVLVPPLSPLLVCFFIGVVKTFFQRKPAGTWCVFKLPLFHISGKSA